MLRLSALVEAELDFSDEDDVGGDVTDDVGDGIAALASEIDLALARPRAERLRDGIRVVIAGPPNAGKSTLLNALLKREAAIVSDIAGTTRDVIEAPVALGGIPFVLTDTAGLREEGAEEIESIGIVRAQQAMAGADIVLWLGDEGEGPDHPRLWEIEAQIDRGGVHVKQGAQRGTGYPPERAKGWRRWSPIWSRRRGRSFLRATTSRSMHASTGC